MVNKDLNTRRATVTGATGFIGAHLARRLVAEGWDVHVIARLQSDLSMLRSIASKIKVYRHDGTIKSMREIVEAAEPDVVFHLASNFIAEHTPEDIEALIETNVTFGTQVVESMIVNGAYKFVNVGTAWQHFENKCYNPVCLYAATKQAFEAILTYYTESTCLRVITLKLFDTYGPDDPRKKLFSFLARVATEKEPVPMSPGEQLVDIVYIDDVVDAFFLAASLLEEPGESFETYAISSQNPIMLRDLVSVYSEVTGRSLSIEWGKKPYRCREVMVPWDRGRILPGWRPSVSLEEGIRKLITATVEVGG